MIYPHQEIVNPISLKKFLDVEIFFLILRGYYGNVGIEVINVWLDRFNEMRKNSGMSLDEISEKAGVPKGTLSKITAGITKAPPLETMRKLVYSMGYTLDDLDDNLPKSKAPPGTDESAPGDEQEKSVMNLVSELTADQQEFLLAWLKTTIELRQKRHPSQQG